MIKPMKTEMALALCLPLVWGGMWHLLRRWRAVRSGWLRAIAVMAWVMLGFGLRALGLNPHIPGVWELFLFPILPFLQAERFDSAAWLHGIPQEQLVFYHVFGMIVGFAILAECIFVQRFL